MLVLTRLAGESIRLNNDIEIRVLGVSGNQVKIGVNAPRNVEVYREEIWRRIQRNEQPEDQVK